MERGLQGVQSNHLVLDKSGHMKQPDFELLLHHVIRPWEDHEHPTDIFKASVRGRRRVTCRHGVY